MSYCAYCGDEGLGVIPLAKHVEGHVRCFVVQNVFEVLNRGKELKCPKGRWAVNWLAELDKHCRPEIAGQVKQLMEMLIHAGISTDSIGDASRDVLTQMEAHKADKDALCEYLLQ